SSPPLEAVLGDQEEFVRSQLENHPDLLQYCDPVGLRTAVYQSSLDGLRDGVRVFIEQERAAGRGQGDNVFDYIISRFVGSAELKVPIYVRLTENETFKGEFPSSSDLAIIHAESIASIISDEYKDHVTRVSCGIIPLGSRA
ncbi:MAG TPA: hypothetical protein VJ044_00180, partial [Candidatus Hodarchaeales archaeon]|nr:hypothetical protein [Candidatus Hodarchaeales archaeon]